MVARGLIKLQRHFGQPSHGASIAGWFRLFASAFKRPQDVTIQVPAMGATVTIGNPPVTVGLQPGATLEERVTALGREITELKAETRSTADALRRDLGTLSRDLRRERHEREEADRRAAQKVEVASVSEIGLEWVGLFWLMAGVVATSVPAEIARLLT
jgi:hypothetical protein